jgi:hypothetical protein
MNSKQDGVSAWLQECGVLLMESSWVPMPVLALKKREFLAFAGRLLLYLDLREIRHFCRVCIVAKWEVINIKPNLYSILCMLKLIEWETDSDIHISRSNSSNSPVNIPIKCLHVAVAWCGSYAISSWRHNVPPITYLRFQLIRLLPANGMQCIPPKPTARGNISELNL